MAMNRRTVLRGLLRGGVISVSLPLLDCFLNTNGTALANGAAMPVRFGTWHWGCGINPERWNPAAAGPDYQITPELEPITPVRNEITVLSGFDVKLDGRSNFVHSSGNLGMLTGEAPKAADETDLPTMDVLVADGIGGGSRFRSLEVTATGDPAHSYSRRNTVSRNPAEPSPVAFYTRIFGPDFQDPNAAEFKPDPNTMMRASVLSAVSDDRATLMKHLGTADRARLDQYFTSVRQLEQQLELQLQKPPAAEACKRALRPTDGPMGVEIGEVLTNHRLFGQLLAMALTCNQTKVFNIVFSDSSSSLRQAGSATTHHTLTHEELPDKQLGYQVGATWFEMQAMNAWAELVAMLSSIKEGDGTLLDHSLVMAHSDTSVAKSHEVVGIPVMLAGKAGGRLKTGLHVKGSGDPISRIGLTIQQVMGLPVDKWGTGAMQTSKSISEILV